MKWRSDSNHTLDGWMNECYMVGRRTHLRSLKLRTNPHSTWRYNLFGWLCAGPLCGCGIVCVVCYYVLINVKQLADDFDGDFSFCVHYQRPSHQDKATMALNFGDYGAQLNWNGGKIRTRQCMYVWVRVCVSWKKILCWCSWVCEIVFYFCSFLDWNVAMRNFFSSHWREKKNYSEHEWLASPGSKTLYFSVEIKLFSHAHVSFRFRVWEQHFGSHF